MVRKPWPSSRAIGGAGRGGVNNGEPRTRSRATRGVDDDGRGGGAGASGAPSVRTAEPERPRGGADGASKSPKAPSSETPSARPKRRRGRPVSRKLAKAPVPGDAMGVASLLWQLAREDEQILGRARIQPHGLEAVVPARADPTSSRASSSREPLRSTARTKIDLDELAALVAAGRSTADIAARFGVTRAAVRKATARLPRRPGDEAAASPTGDSPGGDSPGASDGSDADDDGSHTSVPLYKRAGRRKNAAGDEERRAMAARHAGVARTSDTRRRISATARERWRAAREKATADKTAEVAAAVDKLRREAATAMVRLKLDADSGANDGTKPEESSAASDPRGRRREVAATHSSALPSYNPSAPWEWLAQGAGTASVEDYALGDSPADRAAAFAALLNDKHGGIGNVLASGDFENSVDEGDFESPEHANAFPGAYIPGVKGMPGMSFDEDEDEDDEELRETKRKMKSKLKELAARRAEVVGDGTPKTAKVTVAKFTNELKAFTQLRDDLSDWSDNFLARNGRRPTVKDAERTGIDFLIKSFKEYVELRDRLMSQTPYLRGQMEDVAKETLPTPRVTRDGARRGRAAGVRDGIEKASGVLGGATARPKPTMIFSSPPQGGGILGASGYGNGRTLPPATPPERRNRSHQPRNK